jgi:hypothetical protein
MDGVVAQAGFETEGREWSGCVDSRTQTLRPWPS